ncbi:glycosyltransferase [Blastococcus goldschmidtiae]|uniref:glycosyltransferase n=1 Tax=Blastococcus goldschmidtiae TaxID=3075546 RepID=UPI0037C0D336
MTVLFAANDGGHLAQLWALAPRLGPASQGRVWFTGETEQSRDLLKEERVIWARRAPSRNLTDALQNFRSLGEVWNQYSFTAAVSTGSSIAVSALTQAAARRTRAVYIESATRVDGPSLSGRLLAAVPGVELYTQSGAWTSRRWSYVGSVFDGFRALPALSTPRPSLRVFVSLGTSSKYTFRRLLDRLVQIVPAEWTVECQVGSTDCQGIPFACYPHLPYSEMRRQVNSADIVVAHAGTGIALAAIEAGRCPVLVPREGQEHVDDHQRQLAQDLKSRELVLVSDVDSLSLATLMEAQQRRIEKTGEHPLRVRVW